MSEPGEVRALLVDDERLARAELRTLLRAHPQIAVVGEAADAADAAARVLELAPDVVFLDIQMPGYLALRARTCSSSELSGASGFALLPRIPPACRVVFVTAYSEHAIRAFEVNALDYLLKPVSAERLARTVERLLAPPSARLTPGEDGPSGGGLKLDDPLIFPGKQGYEVIRVSAIVAIHAARDYTEVATADGRRTLVSRSLKDWEARLPEAHFLRVHRGTLVNVLHVERIEPWFGSSFRIHLKTAGEPVLVSRRFASRLRERLV